MTDLERLQKKVTVLEQFLFKKQFEVPTTIKECEAILEKYYKYYGYTYLDVVRMVTNKEVDIKL